MTTIKQSDTLLKQYKYIVLFVCCTVLWLLGFAQGHFPVSWPVPTIGGFILAIIISVMGTLVWENY